MLIVCYVGCWLLSYVLVWLLWLLIGNVCVVCCCYMVRWYGYVVFVCVFVVFVDCMLDDCLMNVMLMVGCVGCCWYVDCCYVCGPYVGLMLIGKCYCCCW